jgi:hypothetical protein
MIPLLIVRVLQNLKGLKDILSKKNPDAAEALMKRYLLPFTVVDMKDENAEKPFLVCSYNTVGGKHRSPWTNILYPVAAPGSTEEPDDLRLLEAKMNDVWDSYKSLYYGSEAVGSVFLRDNDKGAFQGLFGISKRSDSGTWNSLHIVHVDKHDPVEETCHYRVESSILVTVVPDLESSEETKVDISAMLSKEVSKVCRVSPSIMTTSHIENLGKLMEANEIDLRSSLERVHLPKTQEIMDTVQKRKVKGKGVNPLNAMIMGSSVLKKKMESEQTGSSSSVDQDIAAAIQQRKEKKSLPVNPMMGMLMESSVLKKKMASKQ